MEYILAGQAYEKASSWRQALACYQMNLAAAPSIFGVTPEVQRYLLDGTEPPAISWNRIAENYHSLARCLARLGRQTDSLLAEQAACKLASGESTKRPLDQARMQNCPRNSPPAMGERDASYLTSRLTLVILTHYTNKLVKYRHLNPPGTGLVEKTYFSLIENIDPYLAHCRKLLCLDLNQVQSPSERTYQENLDRFSNRFGFRMLSGIDQGLRKMLRTALEQVQTPYMLLIEHDWFFSGPPLCMDYLLRAFDAFPQVNLVRFNQRLNHIERFDFLMEQEPLIPYPPLLRTPAYSNNPCVMRVRTLSQDWLTICEQDAVYGPADLQGTALGIEEPLFKAIVRDIRKWGFEKAHGRWGTYILGGAGDPARIVHLGC